MAGRKDGTPIPNAPKVTATEARMVEQWTESISFAPRNWSNFAGIAEGDDAERAARVLQFIRASLDQRRQIQPSYLIQVKFGFPQNWGFE